MGNATSSTASGFFNLAARGKSKQPEHKILVCGVDSNLAAVIVNLYPVILNEQEYFPEDGSSTTLKKTVDDTLRSYRRAGGQMGLITSEVEVPVPTSADGNFHRLRFFSVAGGTKIYPLWRHCHYEQAASGLVYVFPGGWKQKPEDAGGSDSSSRRVTYLMEDPINYLRYLLGEQVPEVVYRVPETTSPNKSKLVALQEQLSETVDCSSGSRPAGGRGLVGGGYGGSSQEKDEQKFVFSEEIWKGIQRMPVLLLVELEPVGERRSECLNTLTAEARRVASEFGLESVLAKTGRPWKIAPLLLEDGGEGNPEKRKTTSSMDGIQTLREGVDWLVRTAEAMK
eukprot:CAMPEP_0178998590 /NCGR_PEP_ID=MMETSP0795-20121207/9593_1 /TAXON_ID=88552 /ORGANISM="Amoebophrya sp., Strain Ameob2" /LENGTH=339 /DNA_ID=CAMNT_0020691277 /DNA_START=211 /DNA_END=1230 /DNA_ORIENTATION=-